MNYPDCEAHPLFNAKYLRISAPISFGVTLPINILAFHCIINKSPPIMLKHYKWLLINCQTWSFIVDLLATVLFLPVAYNPLWGGYSNGLFRTINVPIAAQFGIMLAVTSCTPDNKYFGAF
ncbi:unnamed protein product [Caenorhabditis auriculariae]|uniref:Uncharacterized protein n=1 Tax=Caenorhabditis auriculariae TaxID=2777116 RepID=A0A8S1HG13_9PELO|nr:unnamed protein product [Caenorhabditis auriculariae]